MAVGLVIEIPGGTQEQYDEVMRQMGLDGADAQWPQGSISHVAGPSDGGWIVVDVWESKQAFESFLHSKLMSATQAAGIGPLQPKWFDVYNQQDNSSA